MLLKSLLISKGHYALKGTMISRTLLILKGHTRKGRSGSEMHREERGRREKEFSITQ